MSTPIESSDVLLLFPTFIWKSQLSAAVHRPIDERLGTVLGELCCDELARGDGPADVGARYPVVIGASSSIVLLLSVPAGPTIIM